MEKRYLAVVEGRPPHDQGLLENFIARQGRKSRTAREGQTGGKTARLTYRVRSSGQRSSLLDIRLETGRRHQIRVQLAAMGCPILGDVAYGAATAMTHGCIGLLARKLAFDHPTQKHRLSFDCPPPEGWPWPEARQGPNHPLWAIEAYEACGLTLQGR